MLWQAVGKIDGPEKAAQLREETQNTKRSVVSNKGNQLDKSTGTGTA